MTTLDERAAGRVPAAAAADPSAEIDADVLPSLDFMRGYLVAYPHPDVIDATMRRWLDALIYECEQMRAALANHPLRANGTIAPYGLSPTELRVYGYLRNTMMSQGEIARTMYVSINTVKTHAKNIYMKCGVNKRAELTNLPNL